MSDVDFDPTTDRDNINERLIDNEVKEPSSSDRFKDTFSSHRRKGYQPIN